MQQYISRHSSNARRSQPFMLVQPVPGYLGPAHAAAAATLPALGGDDFVLPGTFRPSAPKAAPVRRSAVRRAAARPVEIVRTALGVGLGSTLGLSLGVLLCSAILG